MIKVRFYINRNTAKAHTDTYFPDNATDEDIDEELLDWVANLTDAEWEKMEDDEGI